MTRIKNEDVMISAHETGVCLGAYENDGHVHWVKIETGIYANLSALLAECDKQMLAHKG